MARVLTGNAVCRGVTSRGVVVTSHGVVVKSRGVVVTSRGIMVMVRGIVVKSRGIVVKSRDCSRDESDLLVTRSKDGRSVRVVFVSRVTSRVSPADTLLDLQSGLVL